MGTTIVGLIVKGSRISIVHVGDSRMYVMSDGTLQQLTQDDSWTTHVIERDLEGGEVMLLCPDGLHRVLDAEALKSLRAETTDVDIAARKLVDAAIERGSRDNVTALVVHDEGQP